MEENSIFLNEPVLLVCSNDKFNTVKYIMQMDFLHLESIHDSYVFTEEMNFMKYMQEIEDEISEQVISGVLRDKSNKDNTDLGLDDGMGENSKSNIRKCHYCNQKDHNSHTCPNKKDEECIT
ncbi:hypothetical protein C1646_772074 [Rhizophagus diaphanus]|nr:hypothetical protein C1646_772074 [Rhizophagus diaphanus] [Rhizophagus sp. MUCL 43196]